MPGVIWKQTGSRRQHERITRKFRSCVSEIGQRSRGKFLWSDTVGHVGDDDEEDSRVEFKRQLGRTVDLELAQSTRTSISTCTIIKPEWRTNGTRLVSHRRIMLYRRRSSPPIGSDAILVLSFWKLANCRRAIPCPGKNTSLRRSFHLYPSRSR